MIPEDHFTQLLRHAMPSDALAARFGVAVPDPSAAAPDPLIPIAQAAARLKTNPDFVLLLEHLLDHTLRVPIVHLGLKDDALPQAYTRTGENKIVWTILQLIEYGNGKYIQDLQA